MLRTFFCGRWVASLFFAATVCMIAGAGRASLEGEPSRGGSQTFAAKGAISGVVVDAETGSPVPGVVLFVRSAAGQFGQVSDAKGRFLFEEVPPHDRYVLAAVKSGYRDIAAAGASTEIGNTRFPPIQVAAGQWVRDVRVPMHRAGAIGGIVLDEHGIPVVGAHIRVLAELWIAGQRQIVLGPRVQTDDLGAWRIGRLPPGGYYVQMPSVQEAVPASALVPDQVGGPLAASPTPQGGRGGSPAPLFEQTDPLNHVVVGRYPIPPSGDDGRVLVWPSVFFPGVAKLSDAARIELAPGEYRQGITLRVTPMSGAKITGTLDGPPESYAGLTVRLVSDGADPLGVGSEVATALIDSKGRFAFANVPAGEYVIEARGATAAYAMSIQVADLPMHPGVGTGSGYVVLSGADATVVSNYTTNTSGYWGRENVSTNGRDNLDDITIMMREGGSLSGVIAWEGTPKSFAGGVSLLNAEPADGSLGLRIIGSRPDPNRSGSFTMDGFTPGRYVLAPSPLLLSLGVLLKSVTCAGRDMTYVAVDLSTSGSLRDCAVLFTDRGSSVRGEVRDRNGAGRAGTADTSVVVFPAERDQWRAIGLTPARFRGAATSRDGSYVVSDLPAGDYFVCAVPGELPNGWQAEASLAQLSTRAARVHLGWGDRTVQALELAGPNGR